MEPWEIMISESQERMVAVCAPERLGDVEAVCRKWELAHAAIGTVTGTGRLRCLYDGEVVGEIPARLLTDECPRYRVEVRARAHAAPVPASARQAAPDELVELLGSQNVASRAWVYEQYDQLVQSRTVRRPGLDAAVLRLRPGHRGIAVSLDGAGRLAALDPSAGGAIAVLEAARNVACAGGRPLAFTNCLNFGNPEKPEIAWELQEAIEGMALACEALGAPIVSGNVSLYNETDGRAIHPTPVVGCVGLVEDVRLVPSRWRAGDVVSVARASEVRLDGSEYQARFLGGAAGRTAQPDLAAEAALVRMLHELAARLTLAHDAAEGGLAVALAEAAIHSGIGAELDVGWDAAELFGEGGGQVVLACARPDVARLTADGVHMRELGVAGGDSILGLPVTELSRAHSCGLQNAMDLY
jgi:phosphoribosylformylglycinamidine synthase